MEATTLSPEKMLWALATMCTSHRIPFNSSLARGQLAPPFSALRLIETARACGLRVACKAVPPLRLRQVPFPCLTFLDPAPLVDESGRVSVPTHGVGSGDRQESGDSPETAVRDSGTGRDASGGSDDALPALIIGADGERVVCFEFGGDRPLTIPIAGFARRYPGSVLLFRPEPKFLTDDGDDAVCQHETFGFRWFLPELLKHKAIWRDVLLASLAIQLMALATPLCTQVVIDKVVVHHTLSTLTVIGVALLVFMLFTAAMSWVRQYLVLHTGNRVDAVLGAKVFAHLVALPPRYFEQRPTGVIAARLHAVESIREFVAGAAVTLLLDVPFLFIFLAVMVHYSVPLSAVSVAVLAAVVVMSLMVTPVFRQRLNQQFLLAARNQAFLTEYVAGIETVKSLQMEPQLKEKYGEYLASYLHAGFRTRSLSNTYHTLANGLEQLMTLLVLWLGAWLVMRHTDFTIGMLVAFQMFVGRLSQPLLRLVGLWQQFQEANIAVVRLGDILNVPPEPYALTPARENARRGLIEFRGVAFRHAEHLPFLYRNLNLTLTPGRCVAVIGPSGCGKSTLARLMQGFYLPSDGQILLDGRDIRHLPANELRGIFGVVPQETVLFAGTVYENLILANPHARFEQVIAVCKLAGIHETIERLSKGYQTALGERGTGLSGGQRQRLAIARALLRGPKVLLFDEATSGLDAVTAEGLAKTINSFKGRVSTLFIAHHLPKGLAIDEVIQLDGGAVQKKHMSVVS
ncbi:MAG: Toxin RTX-I translocation ATP-binding protein [Gammaproteobacteria bacterium]|nr:Toxin RTX-I translocation ATP-binding protein [Gammaproteobacteria bacterium]